MSDIQTHHEIWPGLVLMLYFWVLGLFTFTECLFFRWIVRANRKEDGLTPHAETRVSSSSSSSSSALVAPWDFLNTVCFLSCRISVYRTHADIGLSKRSKNNPSEKERFNITKTGGPRMTGKANNTWWKGYGSMYRETPDCSKAICEKITHLM